MPRSSISMTYKEAISSLITITNLRLWVHGTGALATDTKDGVHVMVSHVGSLCCLILWVHAEGETVSCHRKVAESNNDQGCGEHDGNGAGLAGAFHEACGGCYAIIIIIVVIIISINKKECKQEMVSEGGSCQMN